MGYGNTMDLLDSGMIYFMIKVFKDNHNVLTDDGAEKSQCTHSLS